VPQVTAQWAANRRASSLVQQLGRDIAALIWIKERVCCVIIIVVRYRRSRHMGGAILAKIEKCMAAWEVFSASGQREPIPLYCPQHDEWQRQHDEVAGAWRDVWCDVLATVPTTRQGAIELIDAFLLYQEADTDQRHYLELLARLKAFLQASL
jgi:hypothetical protein